MNLVDHLNYIILQSLLTTILRMPYLPLPSFPKLTLGLFGNQLEIPRLNESENMSQNNSKYRKMSDVYNI